MRINALFHGDVRMGEGAQHLARSTANSVAAFFNAVAYATSTSAMQTRQPKEWIIENRIDFRHASCGTSERVCRQFRSSVAMDREGKLDLVTHLGDITADGASAPVDDRELAPRRFLARQLFILLLCSRHAGMRSSGALCPSEFRRCSLRRCPVSASNNCTSAGSTENGNGSPARNCACVAA
jgi:hypothetical protein